MTRQDKEELESQFVKDWKEWVRRPSRLSPAQAAARVAARLQPRRPQWRLRLAFGAVSALLLLALALNWTRWIPRHDSQQATREVQESETLGQDEVLMWIDDNTPLYMTFHSPSLAGANGGKI